MNPGSPPPPPLPERPRLRAGCRFILHEFGKGPSWVLENPTNGKFFRMGLREENLARRLDGSLPLKDILESAPAEGSTEQFSPQEILTFLQTLKSSGLLEETDHDTKPAVAPIFNPMFMKIPFGSPDRIFGAIASALQLLPRFPTLIFLGLILIAGGYAVLANLERYLATMNSVFSAANIGAFMVCFLALKVIHETAHGVMCRYFGGRVPDAGLYFMFFVPLSYIDATATWRFPSKWARILVSSAGMLAELVVAAIAGLVWVSTPPGLLNSLASNTVLVASVTTLLFNANPLMRFDGYFILTDLSGFPNLYAYASRAASSWLGWALLGIPRGQAFPLWVTLYGIGCLCWRVTLILGICIGAIALLHGIGIILALLTLTTSYLPLLRRIPKNLATMRENKVQISRVRLALLVMAALVILFVPLESPPASPAVIEPVDMVTVRAQCPGFVEEVTIRPGATVTAGQPLLRLINPEEKTRSDKLDTDARSSEARANILRDSGDPKEMAQHLEQAAALRSQAREAHSYLETLVITAPQNGVIYGRRLEELQSSFLTTGKEILSIGSAREREARIAISQELFDRIRPKVGEEIQILVPGRLHTFPAEVTVVESAATKNVRLESITALAGGPLAVIRQTAAAKTGPNNSSGMELVDPHFYVTARITGANADTLRPGESGLARFPSAPRRTLLAASIAAVRSFIDRAAERVTHKPS